MDNQNTSDTPVVDADIVSQQTDDAKTPPSQDGSAAEVLISLENLIKTYISDMDVRKSDLSKQKEMMQSALTNDETYRNHEQAAKEAAKLKGKTKSEIMKLPQNAVLSRHVQELSAEVKEMDAALSDYLREYQRLSGSTEIETNEGDIREIVYTAKLIKKAQQRQK